MPAARRGTATYLCHRTSVHFCANASERPRIYEKVKQTKSVAHQAGTAAGRGAARPFPKAIRAPSHSLEARHASICSVLQHASRRASRRAVLAASKGCQSKSCRLSAGSCKRRGGRELTNCINYARLPAIRMVVPVKLVYGTQALQQENEPPDAESPPACGNT